MQINARLGLYDFELVVKKGEEYVRQDYVFPNEDMYALIHLANKTGYTVDSITMGFGDINDKLNSGNNYLAVTIDQIIKLEDE